MTNPITLNKGGRGEKTVEASSIQIPDLWHIAQGQESVKDKDAILEVWHLCHDLKDHLTQTMPDNTTTLSVLSGKTQS